MHICREWSNELYSYMGLVLYRRKSKGPAWTGVEYLYNFLTRRESSVGPYGEQVEINDVEPGDIIQLAFDEKGKFAHSLLL